LSSHLHSSKKKEEEEEKEKFGCQKSSEIKKKRCVEKENGKKTSFRVDDFYTASKATYSHRSLYCQRIHSDQNFVTPFDFFPFCTIALFKITNRRLNMRRPYKFSLVPKWHMISKLLQTGWHIKSERNQSVNGECGRCFVTVVCSC